MRSTAGVAVEVGEGVFAVVVSPLGPPGMVASTDLFDFRMTTKYTGRKTARNMTIAIPMTIARMSHFLFPVDFPVGGEDDSRAGSSTELCRRRFEDRGVTSCLVSFKEPLSNMRELLSNDGGASRLTE